MIRNCHSVIEVCNEIFSDYITRVSPVKTEQSKNSKNPLKCMIRAAQDRTSCTDSTILYKQKVDAFIFHSILSFYATESQNCSRTKSSWNFFESSKFLCYWIASVRGQSRSTKLIQCYLIGENFGLLMAPPILEGQTVSPAFIFTKNLIDIKSNLSQFLFCFYNSLMTSQPINLLWFLLFYTV